MNIFITKIKYQWEVCSLTGEVLEDNFNNIDLKLSKSQIIKIFNELITPIEEVKLNYIFTLDSEKLETKSDILFSPEEENIIVIIENRSTRSIQSGMLKKDPNFKDNPKTEILKTLRLMVKKKILIRSGSWYFLKKD